ncbi:Branched-chain amino acid aminotransferase II [Penicillium coprophilum]|uniref:Branched-chain amino acid aminotransferase II n=1 Tax=Penicillium coprophilum TaxID=36646 RepID=UPI002392BAF7|nr:Branched-chain amino acid aminotransferase II [Penicillium coprophilum]KAJ5153733.1 Branched-chain amino acid aminotransferase II [Penicillium coprophilum]
MITSRLDDHLVLDGMIRRSHIELARERLGDELAITERKFTMGEFLEASKENKNLESFATGTAVREHKIDIRMRQGDGPRETAGKMKGWWPHQSGTT